MGYISWSPKFAHSIVVKNITINMTMCCCVNSLQKDALNRDVAVKWLNTAANIMLNFQLMHLTSI